MDFGKYNKKKRSQLESAACASTINKDQMFIFFLEVHILQIVVYRGLSIF